MRPSRPPSRRRALHERTHSESNEPGPSPSLRLVYDMEDSDNNDLQNVYSSTPYPTKPEHVLLPVPGKAQASLPASTYDSAETCGNSTTNLFFDSSVAVSSNLMDQSIGDWDVSSTVDARNTSQSWDGNRSSSRTSFPDTSLPEIPSNHKDNENSDGSLSDSGVIDMTAAPTIRTVVADPSSRQSPATGLPKPDDAASSDSGPNVAPIGAPSTPNYAAFDNSSMNAVRLGVSSNPDSARSNSLESIASFGTVVRHYNTAHWIHSSSPELSTSRSPSFRSSPPYQSVASVRSVSTRPTRERSRSRSDTSSSRRGLPTEIQALMDSGVVVQYPTIRAPSCSSWVDTSYSTFPDTSAQDLVSVDSRGRSHSQLSTVPAQLSREYEGPVLSPVDESFNQSSGGLSCPTAALVSQKPSSSPVWLVPGSETAWRLDDLASLTIRPTNPAVPSSSSSSRNTSLKSSQRPGTGSSFTLSAVPAWARVYYRCDGPLINSVLSLVDLSRPPSARPVTPKSNVSGRVPKTLGWTGTSRPDPRTHDLRQDPQPPSPGDLNDPRTHWVDPEPEKSPPASPELATSWATSWSPHLYPDRNAVQTADTLWTAPSLDSTAEPTLGRRNAQVYLFCFGFICPLGEFAPACLSSIIFLTIIAWFVASFLRLPAKPDMDLDEPGPQTEFAQRIRLLDMLRRRYDNARWWRNVNRWMTLIGIAIIVIVVGS